MRSILALSHVVTFDAPVVIMIWCGTQVGLDSPFNLRRYSGKADSLASSRNSGKLMQKIYKLKLTIHFKRDDFIMVTLLLSSYHATTTVIYIMLKNLDAMSMINRK